MKVLTYTLFKEHCGLYTEIHGSIAINSCHIELTQKDIILLSKVSIIFYKTGKLTGVENSKFIHFDLSAGTYSNDDFNTKIRAAILQQRQDLEPPQIKDLKLVIPEHYTFMADNTIFIALGIPVNYLEKITLIRSTLALVRTKHPLIHHLPQNHCHCTVNKPIRLKTSWMGSHQVCWPVCTFLIIRQLFLQCI